MTQQEKELLTAVAELQPALFKITSAIAKHPDICEATKREISNDAFDLANFVNAAVQEVLEHQ